MYDLRSPALDRLADKADVMMMMKTTVLKAGVVPCEFYSPEGLAEAAVALRLLVFGCSRYSHSSYFYDGGDVCHVGLCVKDHRRD